MAVNRIKGITIEVDGDTTKLQTALKDTDKQLKTTQDRLKDIDKLLKIDPGNIDLLRQKEKYLNDEIQTTQERLKTLKNVSKDSLSPEEWDNLQREITDTEQKLEGLEAEYKNFGSVAEQKIKAVGEKMASLGTDISNAGDKLTMYVTTPIAGLFTGAVTSAANFEGSLAKVQAVSGATGEEMELLKTKASEMGESTKFSASEVADAFNYMAMAGWDTEKMINGIDGVLALSAADGLDLAATSDIVTDALTAFGMQAEDSGRLADVLAAASSSANTNVSMLGESFKYVAPVAGALGYSIEDVSVALGLMANSSVKGSAAGTALRTALVNLSRPTQQMQTYMDKLGISMTDEAGNMLSLGDLIGQLRKKMTVTSQEQIALNYLANQDEDLLGGFADGWENMADAEKKYTTEVSVGTGIIEAMTDAELKEAASKELGINLAKGQLMTLEQYDALAQKLGQDTLDGLSTGEQAAAASAIFGKNAMAGMLAVINSSDEDYQNLTESIYGSSGAAQEMADIMMDTLDGQITILKSKVETLANTFGDILMPTIKDVVDMLQQGLDWLNGLPDGTKTVITQVGLVVAALGPILSIGGRIITALGTTIPAALGVLMAHPFIAGGVILGGLLAAAIWQAYENTESWADADYKMSDALSELDGKIQEDLDLIQKNKDARDENIGAIESEWSHVRSLKTELDKLIDKNGKVKKGYEDRANFIIHELVDATGVEIECIDGVVEGYQDISKEIDNVIETRRNAAILNAFEAEYQTAIQNSKQAQENFTAAVEYGRDVVAKYTTQREKVKTLEEALNIVSQDGVDIQAALNSMGEAGKQIWAEYYEEGDTGYELTQKLKEAWSEEASTLDELEDEYVKSTEAIYDADQAYQTYQTTIDNYEGAMEASLKGDTEAVEGCLDRLREGYDNTADTHEKDLKKMLSDAETEYANIKKAYEDGEEGVTKATVEEANVRRMQAEKDLADYRTILTDGFANVPGDVSKAMSDNAANASGGAQAIVNAANVALAGGLYNADAYGQSYAGHYGSGIVNQKGSAYSGGLALAQQANAGAAAGDNAYTAGSNWGSGYYTGIDAWRSHIQSKAYQIAEEACQSANYAQISRSPSRVMKEAGINFGKGYELGIESEQSAVEEAAAELAETAIGAASGTPDVNGLFNASAGFGGTVNNSSVSYGATSINIYAQPGMDVNELADAVQNRLALLQRQREAAYA